MFYTLIGTGVLLFSYLPPAVVGIRRAFNDYYVPTRFDKMCTRTWPAAQHSSAPTIILATKFWLQGAPRVRQIALY